MILKCYKIEKPNSQKYLIFITLLHPIVAMIRINHNTISEKFGKLAS